MAAGGRARAGLGDHVRQRRDLEAEVRRPDEPLQEQVAIRLVVPVELAVGGDQGERRGARSSAIGSASRGTIRSRANRSASLVASISNETDVDSPAS